MLEHTGAHNGLALITEKLQNQRLEESTAAASASACCGKLPQVTADSSLTTGRADQTNLSVKGKNVWALSPPDQQPSAPHQDFIAPTLRSSSFRPHPANKDLIHQQSSLLSSSSSSSSSFLFSSLCRHNNPRHLCPSCDSCYYPYAPGCGTPSAPPKKKHCRSLSVPPDGPSCVLPHSHSSGGSNNCGSISGSWGLRLGGIIDGSHHHFQDGGARIWRPIAFIPLTNTASQTSKSNTTTTASKNNNVQQDKDRNSNHHFPLPVVPPPLGSACVSMSASTCFSGYNLSSTGSGGSSSGCGGLPDSKLLPRLNTTTTTTTTVGMGSSSSSSSSSSGSHSNSGVGSVGMGGGGCIKLVPSSPSMDSGHFTTSDFQTPPGSPVPRPASAASDISFSSLGSAWHDYNYSSYSSSPFGGGGGARSHRVRVLENRSLSCEDRISSSCSTTTATSMPCVHGAVDTPSSSSRSRNNSGQDGCSGRCNSGGAGAIPRCHSQPCVLHHRRCGKKRRRDCDRPTLNFNKMTETAYIRPSRRFEPWNALNNEYQARGSLAPYNFIEGSSKNPFMLNPIASSPMDSDLPVMVARHLNLHDGYEEELGRPGAKIALPLTPPDHGNSPGLSSQLCIAGGKDDDDDDNVGGGGDDEEEEEDSEHQDCGCHDSRTDDGVDLFPLNDLDLEQIESH